MTEANAPDVPVIGVSKVTGFYGYWITFHDASVESVLIERQGPTVTVVFETCDQAYSNGKLVEGDRSARVVVRWHEVRELSLTGIDPDGRNWINELSLTSCGDWITGELFLMDGPHGIIVARQVEVVEVEPL